jgi:hypothetical protein
MDVIGYSQGQNAAAVAVCSHSVEDGALVGFVAAGDDDFVDAGDGLLAWRCDGCRLFIRHDIAPF